MDDHPAPDRPGFIKAGDAVVTMTKPDARPLSASYKLSPEQSAFFKAQTGIEDGEALKRRILDVQERAYKVFPYNCIRSFSFLHFAITALSTYESILKLGRERPNGIFLDVGACFGVDDDPYPVHFIAGDVMDPNMLVIVPPFEEVPTTEIPDLSTLSPPNPLAGRCSVIHGARLFHLFSVERQRYLARALAGLLSPQPGSIICGQHAGEDEKGMVHQEYRGGAFDVFCHSPQSWTDLWDGDVFAKGKVKVDAKLMRVEESEITYGLMRWSVVRL